MTHTSLKVMDTCLWYLDSGCSRHVIGDRSLFKTFEPKKGGNVTFGNGSKSNKRKMNYLLAKTACLTSLRIPNITSFLDKIDSCL